MHEQESIIFVTLRKFNTRKIVLTLEKFVLEAGTDAVLNRDIFINRLNQNYQLTLVSTDQRNSTKKALRFSREKDSVCKGKEKYVMLQKIWKKLTKMEEGKMK